LNNVQKCSQGEISRIGLFSSAKELVKCGNRYSTGVEDELLLIEESWTVKNKKNLKEFSTSFIGICSHINVDSKFRKDVEKFV